MATDAGLVKLHLISPSHVQPLPDKENFGRFDKVLRSVGSPRTVHVRPRMITVVSDTKYRTTSGFPVSLIGLHGKDELLVVGPDWALLRLAAGNTPKNDVYDNAQTQYRNALRSIVEEAFWLCRVPGLLALATGTSWQGTVPGGPDVERDVADRLLTDPSWRQMRQDVAERDDSHEFMQVAATELLKAMFRSPIEGIQQYFAGRDLGAFVRTHVEECNAKHLQMSIEAEQQADVHTMWWAEWEESATRQRVGPDFLTASGRNILGYPTKPEALNSERPRSYSMHKKWQAIIAKLEKAAAEP